MKYAVYTIVIEDTEENDLAVGSIGADDIDRIAGGLDYEAAREKAERMRMYEAE